MSATATGSVRAHLTVVAFATATFAIALYVRGYANVWLTTGVAAAASGLLAVYVGRAELRARFDLRPKHWIAGAVGGVALAALTWLTYPWLADALPMLATEVGALYGQLLDPPGPIAALPLIAIVVVVEEIVWRGLLYEALARRFGSATTIALSTALYAIPHTASGSWVLVALGVGCGAIWTIQRHVTAGLLAPVLTHLVWNVLVFVVHPVASPGGA